MTRLTLTATTRIFRLDGVQCRLWEGTTDNGLAVHAAFTLGSVLALVGEAHDLLCPIHRLHGAAHRAAREGVPVGNQLTAGRVPAKPTNAASQVDLDLHGLVLCTSSRPSSKRIRQAGEVFIARVAVLKVDASDANALADVEDLREVVAPVLLADRDHV